MNPRTEHEDVDVVVIGGGPGGSTAATLIALEGHRVVLLEKASFPRYQIGESLLPATVHGVCSLLGVGEDLEDAGFMLKRGGTFRWGSNEEPWTFSFALADAFTGPTSVAYQVPRMEFDDILLRNAEKKGVDVREQASALEIEEDDGGRVVTYRREGTKSAVRARYVIDASGNTSRFHGEVGGEREYSEFFKNIALFGYFENGKRLPAPNSGNILCAAFDEGWFWYIPLSDTLTSVGAVVRDEYVRKIQDDKEAALSGFIDSCPLVADMLADADRVTDGPYGELRVRKDYSYSRGTFSSPGMILVGDAACFIDPVFSSGVHLATYSGLLAARTVNTVLAGEVSEERCLEEYEHRYRTEFNRFHDFLVAFYDMHQDEESYFWSARKLGVSGATDEASFAQLVGGASSKEAALRTKSAGTLTQERAGDGRTQELSDLTAQTEPGGDANLFAASVVRDVMEEGTNLQLQADGNPALDAVPVRDGGLVVDGAGIRWREP